MQREEFRNWLIIEKKFDTNTVNSRVGNCSTIEQAYGDLDEHFENDRFSQIMTFLKYSRQNERDGLLPIEPLVIDGVIYDGLATLRQGLNRYSEFKIYNECNEDDTEYNLPNDLSIINGNNSIIESPFQTENKNTLLLLPVKDLNNKTFAIGGYQRGFKWGKKEILELLNDINSYDQSKGLYCLQPLILKPLNDSQHKVTIVENTFDIFTCNEVVDGQQRTTTLYLLLKYLNYKNWISDEFLFEIDFQTRERSGVFLREKLHLIYDISTDSITKDELIEKNYQDLKNINRLWKDFTTRYPEFDNVDVYHFFIVNCYIIRWIDIFLYEELNRNKFIEKLLESVKVIWYSLDHSQKDDQIIKVFLNNNNGKIGLTTSELIKALFILDIKNNEPESIGNLQINQFASEWDAIEKQLQDDHFWYFIQPNEEKYKQGTRIDYLFDLLLKRPENTDDFYAYRHFEKEFNKKIGILYSWEQVVQLYYKLLNWNEDSEIFHFVGFLTNSNIKTLRELLEEHSGKTKDDLRLGLKVIIKNHFNRKDKTEEGKDFSVYALENLHYKKYYSETLKVLLLYNIFYYLDNMANHKFPFELFIKEKWSIEHIIPQNPKDILDINIYYQWFKDFITFGELDVNSDTIEKIKLYTSIEELKKDKELKSDLDKIVAESEDITHSLNNLLLLDRNTNSSLGNKLFDEKRNKILKFDKDGCNEKGKPVFIPNETLNAFNKSFSKQINIKNWTKEDGDNYVVAIQERLQYFVPII